MSIQVIKAFSGQKPIVIYPIYLALTGDYATAAALAQVLYWHEVMRGKFYKTDADFEQELHLTEKQFRRVKTALKSLSFLTITVEQIPAKTFYDVDYAAMLALIESKIDPVDPAQKGGTVPAQKGGTVPAQKGGTVPAQKGGTNTENTTENKTENNNNNAQQKPARNVLKNLTEAEHTQAMKKLESINPEQTQLLIKVFNETTPESSPMMLFNGLLKKAKTNLLEKDKSALTATATQSKHYESEPRAKASPKREGSQAHHAADLMKGFKNGLESTKHAEVIPTPAQHEDMRLEVIKTLLPSKKADWLREFNEKSFVSCRGISGVIIEADLRAAGLFD